VKKFIFSFFILLAIGGVVFVITRGIDKPRNVACTADALICPDGSAVGRGGPICDFNPCPNQSYFDGRLSGSLGDLRLIIPLNSANNSEVSYSIPLKFTRASNVVIELIGEQVAVRGRFLSGNVLEVEGIELITPDLSETVDRGEAAEKEEE
jgi:hypothetical protein